MPKNLEYKSLDITIKSFDAIKGIFKGYAASFNNVDKARDTILPSAFDNSIINFKAGTVVISVNYDHFKEIELAANLSSMITDEYGLLVEFQISEEAKLTYAELYADFIVAVSAGKLFMSVGGYVIQSSLGDDRWIKKDYGKANDSISEFELDHVAITPWPVDSGAKMLEVKSRKMDKVSLNKELLDVDGEVSAIQFLQTNKSEMSNTNIKNFIFHLKSLWKKDYIDIKEIEVKSEIIEPLSDDALRNDDVSTHGSKSNTLRFDKIAGYLK